jgi:GNAT superfamily N-acetyltransferase
MGVFMRTTLRKATLDDSERIGDIYLASRRRYITYAPIVHTDAEVRLWIKTKLIPSGLVTVVFGDDGIKGFVALSQDDTHGWIDHLYIDPSEVGRGLGTLLLAEAKKILGSPIRLYTFQPNQDARRFYQRYEFREIQFSDGASNEERTPDVLLEWS